eukprot:scpid79898/ scgid21773/ 
MLYRHTQYTVHAEIATTHYEQLGTTVHLLLPREPSFSSESTKSTGPKEAADLVTTDRPLGLTVVLAPAAAARLAVAAETATQALAPYPKFLLLELIVACGEADVENAEDVPNALVVAPAAAVAVVLLSRCVIGLRLSIAPMTALSSALDKGFSG